jgi:hypothetical protein
MWHFSVTINSFTTMSAIGFVGFNGLFYFSLILAHDYGKWTLRITNCTPDDSGKYSASIKNRCRTLTSHVKVQVLTKPAVSLTFSEESIELKKSKQPRKLKKQKKHLSFNNLHL